MGSEHHSLYGMVPERGSCEGDRETEERWEALPRVTGGPRAELDQNSGVVLHMVWEMLLSPPPLSLSFSLSHYNNLCLLFSSERNGLYLI